MTLSWPMSHPSLSLTCNSLVLNNKPSVRMINHSFSQTPMSSQIPLKRLNSSRKAIKHMANRRFLKTTLPRRRKSLRSSTFSSHRLSLKNTQAVKNAMKSMRISTTTKEAIIGKNGVWACSRCFFKVPVFSQTYSTFQRWSRSKSTQWNTKSHALFRRLSSFKSILRCKLKHRRSSNWRTPLSASLKKKSATSKVLWWKIK